MMRGDAVRRLVRDAAEVAFTLLVVIAFPLLVLTLAFATTALTVIMSAALGVEAEVVGPLATVAFAGTIGFCVLLFVS